MEYNGGKNGAGTYQTIINLIPPHHVYIEPFGGSAAILRHKRPAHLSFVVEIDPGAINSLTRELTSKHVELWNRTKIIYGSGYDFLLNYKLSGNEFIYLDPPYLHETRTSTRPLYKHELSRSDHLKLLFAIRNVPCFVMISGYHDEMYIEQLADWSHISFQVIKRNGELGHEHLWFNYPPPSRLHDYRYLGDNYRQREMLNKRRRRWIARLKNMPEPERLAMLATLYEEFSNPYTAPIKNNNPLHRRLDK